MLQNQRLCCKNHQKESTLYGRIAAIAAIAAQEYFAAIPPLRKPGIEQTLVVVSRPVETG